MNKFLNFFTTILFISTAILISCGGTAEDTPAVEAPQDLQGALLSTGRATASSVKVDNVASTDWASFSTEFTFSPGTGGGTFTTTGSASDLVWPSSGTWAFVGTGTSQILRSDNQIIDVSVRATDMILSFDVTDPNGRILTFGGSWIFELNF